MPSFDIVSRIDMQEVDNAVNITTKTILTRYDFRNSKTAISLDKKEKKSHVVTEDDMKMRAVQDTLIENLVKRKVDRRCLDSKSSEAAALGMLKHRHALSRQSRGVSSSSDSETLSFLMNAALLRLTPSLLETLAFS